jgi:hypothetical protein
MKTDLGWVVATGAAFLFLPAHTSAATPGLTSDVSVDWSSLTVTPLGDNGGAAPVLSWDHPTSTVNAYTSAALSVGDWTTPLTTSIGGPAASAEADLDASVMHTYAQDTDAAGDTSGSIWALREGEFSVAGTGSVLITVNYSWHATLYPPANANFWDSFAYGFVSLRAETHNDPRSGNNRGDYQEANLQLLAPPDIGPFQYSGSVAIAVPVIDGDYLYFTANASSTTNLYTSAVPMPPTLWLFAGGLAVLAGPARWARLARRRT